MDTIIYLCRKRNAAEKEIQMMYQDDYLFVRAAVTATADSWFGRRIPKKPTAQETGAAGQGGKSEPYAENGICGENSVFYPAEAAAADKAEGHRHALHKRPVRRREHRRPGAEQAGRRREYCKQLLEYEIRTEALSDSMAAYTAAILRKTEEAGGGDGRYCVYEPSVAFLKETDRGTGFFWNMLWNIPEFWQYTEYRWSGPLLSKADGRFSDYVVLGCADCMFELLADIACRMKRLTWYLLKKEFTEELQEKTEGFYEAYGLAVTVCPLESAKDFRSLRLSPPMPVCVLDFCREERLFAGELRAGSLWLDFTSAVGKELHITRRSSGVVYESMRKVWGRMEKRNRRYI